MIPKLLTIEEVADIARAPVSSVRCWAYTGRLITVKVGRRRLVREKDLVSFIAQDQSGGPMVGEES